MSVFEQRLVSLFLHLSMLTKRTLGLTLFISLILSACPSLAAQESGFQLHRGLNISHWLSQSGARGAFRERFFTEKDVAYIASEGFDHLRIPVDEEQLFLPDGQKDTAAFALLHNGLSWCRKYNLRAIVDLHILRSHNFNAAVKPLFTDEKAQQLFFNCWEKISAELKDYSNDWVAYELMNEPVADNPEDWNKLVKSCVALLRDLEPERVLVIGSNRWQSYETVKDLYLPQGDRNIIISFHYYEPFLLTHYQASWTQEREYTGGVHYPGPVVSAADLSALPEEIAGRYSVWTSRVYDKETFARHFGEVLSVARSYGVSAYCGEYGCINSSPVPDRLRWWRDINEVFEEMGIARAVWDYKGSFGILKQGQPDRPMLDALMGKESK